MRENLNQNESCVQPSSTFPSKPIQVESSSSKTRPSGISSCFPMLIIIPEIFTQWFWVLWEQTRDGQSGIKSKGGLQKSAKGTRVAENDKSISDEASSLGDTKDTNQKKRACTIHACWSYDPSPDNTRPHKLRAKAAERCKGTDVQTLAAAGAAPSARRAKHLLTACYWVPRARQPADWFVYF